MEKLKSKPPIQPKSIKHFQDTNQNPFRPQLPTVQPHFRKTSVQFKCHSTAAAKIRSKINTPNPCRALFNTSSNEKKENPVNRKRKSAPTATEQTPKTNIFPIQKICKPNYSVKYINGKEPMIIRQSIDPLSGK